MGRDGKGTQSWDRKGKKKEEHSAGMEEGKVVRAGMGEIREGRNTALGWKRERNTGLGRGREGEGETQRWDGVGKGSQGGIGKGRKKPIVGMGKGTERRTGIGKGKGTRGGCRGTAGGREWLVVVNTRWRKEGSCNYDHFEE